MLNKQLEPSLQDTCHDTILSLLLTLWLLYIYNEEGKGQTQGNLSPKSEMRLYGSKTWTHQQLFELWKSGLRSRGIRELSLLWKIGDSPRRTLHGWHHHVLPFSDPWTTAASLSWAFKGHSTQEQTYWERQISSSTKHLRLTSRLLRDLLKQMAWSRGPSACYWQDIGKRQPNRDWAVQDECQIWPFNRVVHQRRLLLRRIGFQGGRTKLPRGQRERRKWNKGEKDQGKT